MLNTDYKIFTKVIANRIRKVAANLVSEDQSCGLPNRNIHDQLYFIRDYIEFFNETNKRGLIISVDQEKCFDRIDHRLVHKVLERFNFGPMIKTLIRTVYMDMRSRVSVNGRITQDFQVTRSIRQGDSLSMILAVLVGELLGEMLRQNMEVTPICLPNSQPRKVAQYADDTSVVTDNPKALNSLWRTIRKYERTTGAKVNASKTEILLVGKWSRKQRENIAEGYGRYVKGTVRILGVSFGKNAKSENEEGMKKNIENEIEKWKDRNLSMSGKVSVLKTLVTSKLWHIAKVTRLRKRFMSWVNTKMLGLFWYPKKYHPISTQTLQREVGRGGQNFPDIENELRAYYVETIAIAERNPQKPWVGMVKYRHGRLLRKILQISKYTCITEEQSATSRIVHETLEVLEGKVATWGKMDFGKLLEKLRENEPGIGTQKKWLNIHRSSKNPRQVELNYQLAHERLPVGDYLVRTNISKDDKCRLCRKEVETHKHLFYDCETIQSLKGILKNEFRKLCKSGSELHFEQMVWHTPKLSSKMSKRISDFKHAIWRTRAGKFYGNVVNAETHMLQLYSRS